MKKKHYRLAQIAAINGLRAAYERGNDLLAASIKQNAEWIAEQREWHRNALLMTKVYREEDRDYHRVLVEHNQQLAEQMEAHLREFEAVVERFATQTQPLESEPAQNGTPSRKSRKPGTTKAS